MLHRSRHHRSVCLRGDFASLHCNPHSGNIDVVQRLGELRRYAGKLGMSPELEILDQLLGGDLSLVQCRYFFRGPAHFVNSVSAMNDDGQIRILDANGDEVPRWRRLELLGNCTEGYRLSVTDAGAQRIS